MDQLEFENYIVKIKHRKEEGDYKTAAYIADKIDWEEVKDINLLLLASNVYEENKDYQVARDLLAKAYKIAPIKNRLYYSLCLINIKLKDMRTARDFYIDFCVSFPNDPRKSLLKYYYLRAKGADIDQQIRLLEEYVEEEKDEAMIYELATLYDELGDRAKVIELCDYIVDFFGVKIKGYGRDALYLKKKYVELSIYERGLLTDNQYSVENLDSSKEDYNYDMGENDRLAEIKRIDEKNENINKEKEKLVVEKVNRKDDEVEVLDEKNQPQPSVFDYKADIDSYKPNESELVFLNDNNSARKNKVKSMIEELKKEEDNEGIELAFNEFREKSFDRKRRFKDMRIEDLKLHMIIEAYSKDEGVEIAKAELDYIHKVRGEKVQQAKVSAYNLNDKGFDYFLQKLGKRDLIIESAGRLKEPELDNIEEFMLNKKNTNIIVLIDVINNFDRLAKNRPSFLDRFDIYSVVSAKKQEKIEVGEPREEAVPKLVMSENEKKIVTRELEDIKQNIKDNEEKIKKVEKIVDSEDDIPIQKNEVLIQKALEVKKEKEKPKAKIKNRVSEENKGEEYSIDKFVEYCKSYAKSIDCVIPGKVIPALYEVVEEMADEGMKLNEENAINLIEDAADRAEKPKLFGKPKYDKEGCLIISEEHLL